MSKAKAILYKGKGRSLKAGGLWVYDNEIDRVEGDFTDGDLVEVSDFDGYPLGIGFINGNSVLRIRMMSRKADAVIDDSFLEQRIRAAWEYRKKTVDVGSCRIIFGEADFLPGFIADKYNDVLSIQSLALGIDRYKLRLVNLIKKVLLEDGIRISGVYERSDVKVRKQEGMDLYKGFIGDPFDTRVTIVENGIRMVVDIAEGQKTGYFLDQKYNRLAIRSICRDARVLDCFTHTGAFALNAGFGGAREVIGVDVSELGVAQAEENARLNGLENVVSFRCRDVLELLPELIEQREQFDVVILDPPAFTKSKDSVKNAMKGYREINLRAMKLIRDGGFLVTCSCSHFMTPELFTEAIRQAAQNAHKRIRQVEYRTQSADHPILWAAEESAYLKFYILQVTDEK